MSLMKIGEKRSKYVRSLNGLQVTGNCCQESGIEFSSFFTTEATAKHGVARR